MGRWILIGAMFAASAAFGQTRLDNPQGAFVDRGTDSGERANPGAHAATIWSEEVSLPGAGWTRVYFGAVSLARGSSIRVTSLADGDVQELDARAFEEWGATSAYFNGGVRVELVGGAFSKGNRLVIERVAVHAPSPAGGPGECGICGEDDRTPSTMPWAGRLMPSGCTASVYTHYGCIMTAGHCASQGQVIQFNVPASNGDCSLNMPPAADQFPVLSISGAAQGPGADWGAGRTGRNSLGQTIFDRYQTFIPVSTTPASIFQGVTVFGYGRDRTCERSGTQQRSPGSIQQTPTATYYTVNTDVREGSSGSPIVRNNAVIGVITHCTFECPNYGTRVDAPDFAFWRARLCPCPADFNGDGQADFFDYLDFVQAFSDDDPSADFNGDGQVDFFDYLDFVAAFDQGC